MSNNTPEKVLKAHRRSASFNDPKKIDSTLPSPTSHSATSSAKNSRNTTVTLNPDGTAPPVQSEKLSVGKIMALLKRKPKHQDEPESSTSSSESSDLKDTEDKEKSGASGRRFGTLTRNLPSFRMDKQDSFSARSGSLKGRPQSIIGFSSDHSSESEKKSHSIFSGAVAPADNMTPRDWAAREIYTSEYQYGGHLDSLVNTYLPHLKTICTPKEIKTIFANVEVLRNFSMKLLSEIEERMKSWTQESLIADLVVKFVPFFKAYSQYCNNYDEAIECYVSCMQTKPEFATFCNAELAKTPSGLGPDLQSLLITPVQRIPRYILLLKELQKLTPKTHADAPNIVTALEKIMEITEAMNKEIKQSDKYKVFYKLLTSVKGIMPYMAPHRKYLNEYPLKVCTIPSELFEKHKDSLNEVLNQNTFLDMWIALFSDSFVLLGGNLETERKLLSFYPYNSVWFEEDSSSLFPPGENNRCFRMTTPEEEIFVLATVTDFENFYKALKAPITEKYPDLDLTKPERTFEYKFASGDTYSGSWKVAKMQGEGYLKFSTGRSYTGEFVDNKMNGQGILNYGNRASYKGSWKDGKPHGKGVLEQPEARFDGTWKNGEMRKGCLEWQNGDKYDGELKRGQMHGEGTLLCANGDIYVGHWKNNMRHGTGEMQSLLGKYTGSWASDVKEGEGKFVFANGEIYEGGWKDNMRSGQGKMTTTQYCYEGQWVQDRREGKGSLTTKLKASNVNAEESGGIYSKYEGEWKDGRRHGFGTLFMGEDFKYEGNWANDQREGDGSQTDCTGTYIGKWKEDKRHGMGVFISADKKTTFKGMFQNDFRIEGEYSYEDKQGRTKLEKFSQGKTKPAEKSVLLNSNAPEVPPLKVFL